MSQNATDPSQNPSSSGSSSDALTPAPGAPGGPAATTAAVTNHLLVLLPLILAVIGGAAYVANLNSKIDTLSAKLDANNVQVTDVRQTNATLKTTIDGLEKGVGKAQDSLSEAQRTLTRAEDAQKQAKIESETVKKDTIELNDKLTAAETRLKAKVDELSRQADAMILDQMPVGSIIMWPSSTVPSSKWMACNGDVVPADVDTADYRKLVADTVLSAEKGRVVRVPDLRGRFVRAADDREQGKVDPDSPRKIASEQAANFDHSHVSDGLHVAGGLLTDDQGKLCFNVYNRQDLGGDRRLFWGTGGDSRTINGRTEVFSMAIAGGIGPVKGITEVRPANIALNFIVRVRR